MITSTYEEYTSSSVKSQHGKKRGQVKWYLSDNTALSAGSGVKSGEDGPQLKKLGACLILKEGMRRPESGVESRLTTFSRL